MKYELNTPYDLEVKNVIQDKDSLAFEVEVGGSLFPVKAYPEQIEESIPTTVSCRIMLDKNRNAYLTQNEAFLFPFLYKPNKRYIFEVVDIRDGYVTLKDKHGLFHSMQMDGTMFSVNEIIVRCVNIIMDNGYKAHLGFYYTDVVVEKLKQEIHDFVPEEPKVQPQYAPTIFEEDTPKVSTTKSVPLPPVVPAETKQTRQESPKAGKSDTEISISFLLKEKEWSQLNDYFDNNLGKAKTPAILKEITAFIENCISGKQYWETIKYLVDYDAHMFLGTIAKVDTSHIFDIADTIDHNCLDGIVRTSFEVTDRLKYALDLIAKCSKHLSIEHKNYIQFKCKDLNTPDSFFNLFKILRLNPDDAIVYLLSLKDNIAAAFTIYKFYLIGKNNNVINERSQFVAFKPSKINEYIQFMVRMQSDPFNLSASLINVNILSKGYCPTDLRKTVEQEGYEGFFTYATRKQQKKNAEEVKRTLESLTRGDNLTNLVYKSQTDNYFVLRSPELGVFALLDKKLTKVTPNNDNKTNAKIMKVMTHNGKKCFIVAQKPCPSMYTFPQIFDNTTQFDVVFHVNGSGHWQPAIKKYGFLIDTDFAPILFGIDYSAVYKARIIKRKNFFSYLIQVV